MGFRIMSLTNRYKIVNPTDSRYLGEPFGFLDRDFGNHRQNLKRGKYIFY